MAPCTANSRSASARTMKAACPPSSMEQRTISCAHWRKSKRPVSVLPVKLSLRTRPSISHVVAMDLASPVNTCKHCGGSPHSKRISASAKAESGVSSAGLASCTQPAARAGATLRANMANGKFQGVIAAHTPIALWRTTPRTPGRSRAISISFSAWISLAAHEK